MHSTTILKEPLDRTGPAAAGSRAPITFAASPFGSPQCTPTSEYERRFRRRLRDLGGDAEPATGTPRRPVVSTLVASLRGGNTPDHVLSIALGLNASDLAQAYDHLDRLRRTACDALDDLFFDPTIARFQSVVGIIEPLIPQIVGSLTVTARDQPDLFEAEVRRFEQRMEELAQECDTTEALIERGMRPAGSLVARLDDGRGGGIHHEPAYRPSRVGDLTPVRLAALLGESLKEPVR